MSLVNLMMACQAETCCLIETGINSCVRLDLLCFLSERLIICRLITTKGIRNHILLKITNMKFIKNPLRKSRVFACGQTDGQT